MVAHIDAIGQQRDLTIDHGDAIPGHVKWPRTQMHYVQVSVGGYSLISYAFQIDVEARTSNSAALFGGV